VLSSKIHHIDSPFSARVIVSERDSAKVAEAQKKLPQIEALAMDANIPGDSSSLAPNSDLKLTGIHCRKPKVSIVIKEKFITALKNAKKR
jgi:hypothetical protein